MCESEAKLKAARISSSFINPFLKYLPAELWKCTVNDASSHPAMSNRETDLWKLLPNTVKTVEEKKTGRVEVIQTASKLEFSLDLEEQQDQVSMKEALTSLREMVTESKKAAESNPDLVVIASEHISSTGKTKNKTAKKRKSDDAGQEKNLNNFQSFDYKQEDFEKLMRGESPADTVMSTKRTKRGKKGKKAKEYNPGDTRTAEPDFRAAAKPRFSQSTSNRSVSYASSSGGGSGGAARLPKIQWPSR